MLLQTKKPCKYEKLVPIINSKYVTMEVSEELHQVWQKTKFFYQVSYQINFFKILVFVH